MKTLCSQAISSISTARYKNHMIKVALWQVRLNLARCWVNWLKKCRDRFQDATQAFRKIRTSYWWTWLGSSLATVCHNRQHTIQIWGIRSKMTPKNYNNTKAEKLRGILKSLTVLTRNATSTVFWKRNLIALASSCFTEVWRYFCIGSALIWRTTGSSTKRIWCSFRTILSSESPK